MAENLKKRPRVPKAPPPPVAALEIPGAPEHPSEEAVTMWDDVVSAWVLGPDGLPILRAALKQWDVYQAARAQVARDGATVTNPETGVVRQHPAALVARDALREYRQSWRQLAREPEG